MEINGVKFDLEAMKGYTKEKFVRQNKNRFKDPAIIWDMIADKVEVKKPKKKKRNKVEEQGEGLVAK